jgi:hypothetical protein
MKKSSILILLLSITVAAFTQQKTTIKPQQVKSSEQPAEAPSGKFIGEMFNDFSYVLQEPQPLNPAKGNAGKNSFLFRRATIGYEYLFNKNVTARILYNADNNVFQQGFVDIRNIVPLMDVKIGLMQTLSSEVTEKIWDYRSLEATVLDRKGYTNEFDMGMTLTGRTNAQGNSYARLAVYNGNGVLPENNKLKKIAFAAGNWFDKSSVLEVYADYENLPNGKSTINGKLFYGMTSTKLAFGAEVFYRLERKMAVTFGDKNPAGVSLFSWFEMTKSLRGVARVDVIDDDLANSNATITNPSYREIYFNAGIDYMPVANVHLIPNLIYDKELKKGTSSEIVDRMEVRLTTAVNIK